MLRRSGKPLVCVGGGTNGLYKKKQVISHLPFLSLYFVPFLKTALCFLRSRRLS